MTANSEAMSPISSARRRARQFRIAAIFVLLLGAVGVGLVYWLGSRSVDLSNDPSMLGYQKSESFQMEKLYGQQGLLMDELYHDLKQPGTQALIISVVAVVAAGVCFYFARLLDFEHDQHASL
jgi:hypothetical protein